MIKNIIFDLGNIIINGAQEQIISSFTKNDESFVITCIKAFFSKPFILIPGMKDIPFLSAVFLKYQPSK